MCFRLVTNVQRREKPRSLTRIEPQTFGFHAPMLHRWTTKILRWARPLLLEKHSASEWLPVVTSDNDHIQPSHTRLSHFVFWDRIWGGMVVGGICPLCEVGICKRQNVSPPPYFLRFCLSLEWCVSWTIWAHLVTVLALLNLTKSLEMSLTSWTVCGLLQLPFYSRVQIAPLWRLLVVC